MDTVSLSVNRVMVIFEDWWWRKTVINIIHVFCLLYSLTQYLFKSRLRLNIKIFPDQLLLLKPAGWIEAQAHT